MLVVCHRPAAPAITGWVVNKKCFEDVWMSTLPRLRRKLVRPLRPTAYLLHPDPDEFGPIQVYQKVLHGFAFADVRDLLSATSSGIEPQVWARILGLPQSQLSPQRKQRLSWLTPQQSATALNYSCILELAIEVFGSQKSAEDWLIRPCTYFGRELPLDILTTAIGFQALEIYLKQIAYGLYL